MKIIPHLFIHLSEFLPHISWFYNAAMLTSIPNIMTVYLIYSMKHLLCVCVCVCVCVHAQSCSTLCDLIDCSPPGSSVHWIFQARLLEWVALSSSRGSSWSMDQIHLLYLLLGRQILYHCTTFSTRHLILCPYSNRKTTQIRRVFFEHILKHRLINSQTNKTNILLHVLILLKLKDASFLEEKLEQKNKPRQLIKKQRHYFADKGPSSQSYGFSSSHVWTWVLDHKKTEHRRIDAFEF